MPRWGGLSLWRRSVKRVRATVATVAVDVLARPRPPQTFADKVAMYRAAYAARMRQLPSVDDLQNMQAAREAAEREAMADALARRLACMASRCPTIPRRRGSRARPRNGGETTV